MNEKKPAQGLVYWILFYLDWYKKGSHEFIQAKGMYWTNLPIPAVARLLRDAATELGSPEPRIHSNLTGKLLTVHPLHCETVVCHTCSCLLHGSDNKNSGIWVETGKGNYCLRCFAHDNKASATLSDDYAIPSVKSVDIGEIPPAFPKVPIALPPKHGFDETSVLVKPTDMNDEEFETFIEETRSIRKLLKQRQGVNQPGVNEAITNDLNNLFKARSGIGTSVFAAVAPSEEQEKELTSKSWLAKIFGK